MIFRSRTTKASSNVTEQKACRRSFVVFHELDADFGDHHSCSPLCLWHTQSQLRTIEHTRIHPLLRSAAEPTGDAPGFAGVTTQGEQTAAAAARRLTRAGPPAEPGLHRRASLTLLHGFALVRCRARTLSARVGILPPEPFRLGEQHFQASRSTGLTRCWSKPASWGRRRSSSCRAGYRPEERLDGVRRRGAAGPPRSRPFPEGVE